MEYFLKPLTINSKKKTASKLDEKSKYCIPSKYAKFQNLMPL
jgi:hypothetical protein